MPNDSVLILSGTYHRSNGYDIIDTKAEFEISKPRTGFRWKLSDDGCNRQTFGITGFSRPICCSIRSGGLFQRPYGRQIQTVVHPPHWWISVRNMQIMKQNGKLKQVDPDGVRSVHIIVIEPGTYPSGRRGRIRRHPLLIPSALTGGPVRSKCKGFEIISSCVNGSGLLKVRTTKGFDDSTVCEDPGTGWK